MLDTHDVEDSELLKIADTLISLKAPPSQRTTAASGPATTRLSHLPTRVWQGTLDPLYLYELKNFY